MPDSVASSGIPISDAALFILTDMTPVPESVNFTKGVQRHVYLALLERVEPRAILRANGIPTAGSKDNRKVAGWKGRDPARKATIRIYDQRGAGE